MWEKLLDTMLRRMIVEGRLVVDWPDGRQFTYGPGGGLEARVGLVSNQIVRRLCLRPELALGEGYMDGEIEIAPEALYELLTLLVRNRTRGGLPVWVTGPVAVQTRLRRVFQHNNPLKSKRNVAHHYDLSDELYELFLDADRQYSCAYFETPDMTLEDAQIAKKAHIAGKLLLRPGQRVLDIGCGWGGMALTLAREHGVYVTGVTLSERQLAVARRRAQETGLADKVDFRLCDYRKLNQRFDRIVSVGMLEHVGLPHFDEYFSKVNDLLNEDGIALIHTIGRTAPPQATAPWIDKYIFPGGYVPSLSDLAPALERSGLWIADIESLRGHYGPTLHQWRLRFEDRLDAVRQMYDERFVRMWRYYLVACEMAFEEQKQVVFQMQLSRRQHSVPATRRYLYPTRTEAIRHAAE